MRFLANGPRIPDELLEARDNGNVVFFCGAGVSQPAGLPGFRELARQLVDKLGAPSDARSRVLLSRVLDDPEFAPSIDQVFHHLRQEYGAVAIDAAVSELLTEPAEANVEQHAVILRLSRSAGGRPQLVTTNFDILFERVGEALPVHIGPALPDLRYGQPIDGLVYLHGRRAEHPSELRTSTLILGSADFGRAYLAEGWGTTFVTNLLRNYVIVLVGYSAGDPPVRYLLEGLHARNDAQSARIYTFDRGSVEAVKERWRDRGVTALAYPDGDSRHSALWDTLQAWAERATDLNKWQRSVIDLAHQRPTTLQPHQRGQVASLVRNDVGAKLFADANPPPPAEWLCVFDEDIRCAEPQTVYGEDRKFDPLDHYGLDDDTPRLPQSERTSQVRGGDLLSSDPRTELVEHRFRLAANAAQQTEPLTPRLIHLARWLARLLDDPVLAWWAAEYRSLHPVLLGIVEWQLERDPSGIHQLAYRAWTLLVERFRHPRNDAIEHRWYRFSRRIKGEGWAPAVLRDFERVARPRLASTRPAVGRPFPPRADWRELHLREVVSFEVEFPRIDLKDLPIALENLSDIFRILRRGLEHASGLLKDIETVFWRTATFHPENKPGEVYLTDRDKYLQLVVRLFDRLAAEYPNRARVEVNHWPTDETFFFDKLRIYAGMKPSVLLAGDVISWLLSLPEARFWNSYHRRELLHTLRARWAELESDAQAQIESRIIAGPSRWTDEEDANYRARKASTAATILGWLQRHGCQLSPDALELLPGLREADPRWQPAWDEGADASLDAYGGWVQTQSDPSEIINAPVAKLLALAEQYGSRRVDELIEHDPFQGVVQQRPRRALATLSYAARRDEFPQKFWQTLVSHWPANVPQRLRWTLAYRLVRLPTPIVSTLRYYISDWFRQNLPALAQSSLPRALDLWDQLFQHFVVGGADATISSLGDTFIRGVPQHRSRRTHGHALNSPIGRLADVLLAILRRSNVSAGARISAEIKTRLERAMTAPGEGRDHAISELAVQLTWLHHLDPVWVREQFIPLFDPTHHDSEPAWNGYAYDSNNAGPELFTMLKQYFLEVFRFTPQWHWDDGVEHHFTKQLVQYCWWHLNDARYITYSEARKALQGTDDQGRAHAAWVLGRIVKDHQCWQLFGKPFLQLAWPRERRCQTPAVSSQLASVALASGDDFPDAVQTLRLLLVPVERLDILLHEMTEDPGQNESQLAERFPEALLALLDSIVPRSVLVSAYGLGSLLTSIATSAPQLRQDRRWRRLDSIAHR